jgi:succinate-semialdehyde dehydrogenase / glutarate-semialdehyde dehydrogenase
VVLDANPANTSNFMSVHVQLFIDGAWVDGAAGRTIPIVNPATGQVIGDVAHAELEDLTKLAETASAGFKVWRRISAFERSKILRKAAAILRERAPEIARTLTTEEGKPLPEAMAETLASADVIDWFAEEARRTYGMVIPARAEGVYQLLLKEPVGVSVAFAPWNFPLVLSVRKLAAALAAGCSVILKAPEEAPGSCSGLVKAFADAGVPRGGISLVFGDPAQISEFLIAHPVVRKISFTGSTRVGKHLASLAGLHMKRVTMELGGHAPVLVFNDADLESAAKSLVDMKFRNAGQICIAPTRFLVQRSVYQNFVDCFVATTRTVKVGDGLDAGTKMGPLVRDRRVCAVEELVTDAVARGAGVPAGGERIGGEGYFYSPTVVTGPSVDSRLMNEEPFGPVAAIVPFDEFDDAIREANRLPYGLAAYAYTKSTKTATLVASALESGMVSINHYGLSLPETPFGGVKDSGYGSEGGPEGIEAYLNTKFVSQAGV